MEGKYSQSPDWADVTPIPLNDGTSPAGDGEGDGATPLAVIAYQPAYLEATSYLRAVMAANEMSERALRLTEDVISMNPAHYTVWLYRSKILFALEKDLNEEIAWLNKVSLKYLKNYQIWHHRQLLLSSRTAFPSIPSGELDFLMQMFTADSKNYHVWTYRQWLVRHFDLWDSPREIADVDELLANDVRNNSAWNHRYMLRFAPRQGFEACMSYSTESGQEGKGKLGVVDEDLVDAELNYTQTKIMLAPENRSAWLYARGVLRAADRPLAEWKGFASRFITEEIDSNNTAGNVLHVKSSLAVEWLADVFAQEAKEQQQQQQEDSEETKGKVDEAVRLLTLLKEKYDPVRVNYWEYRIREVKRPVAV